MSWSPKAFKLGYSSWLNVSSLLAHIIDQELHPAAASELKLEKI
jgi:hypothetical protein